MTIAAIVLALSVASPARAGVPVVHGDVHDFDFEFGAWKAQLRVRAPLSNANKWTTFTGTSTVKPFWNGRSNYGELDVGNASTHIEGLTLRLYHPKEHRWYISFANGADGKLGTPMLGGFSNGIGTFYDREVYDGKAVLVRFVFSGLKQKGFRFVQSYSADDGRTWIPNWEATFTR